MKKTNKKQAWGKVIRSRYGEEKMRDYKRAYKRAWDYKRKTGYDINPSREAAMEIIYGSTTTSRIISQSRGVRDADALRKIDALNRFQNFVDRNRGTEIYGTKYTVGDVAEMYDIGFISYDEFVGYMEKYKKSPFYVVNMSE